MRAVVTPTIMSTPEGPPPGHGSCSLHGVDAGDADRRRLVTEGGEHGVRRSLERGAGDDRRDGDDVGFAAPRLRRARRAREHRSDRDDRVGGRDHDRVGVGQHTEHVGSRSGRVHTGEAHRLDADRVLPLTKYAWKPISPSSSTVTIVRTGSSLIGSSRSPRSHARAISPVTRSGWRRLGGAPSGRGACPGRGHPG